MAGADARAGCRFCRPTWSGCYIDDALHYLSAALALEGRSANEQLVREDADAPQVYCCVVLLALDDLGRRVVQGPAEGFSHGLDHGRPAEVAELGDACRGDHDVFGLDIAVGDVEVVQVNECIDDVFKEANGLFGGEDTDLVLVIEESASA